MDLQRGCNGELRIYKHICCILQAALLSLRNSLLYKTHMFHIKCLGLLAAYLQKV